VWSYDGQAAGDTLGIEALRLDDAFEATGEPFRVRTEVEGNHWLGDVACGPGGGFVVAGVRTDTDGTTWGVFVRRYDADGQPSGDAVTVNPTPAGDQTEPVVGVAGDGTIVVAWDDLQTDSDLHQVLARVLVPGPPEPSEALVVAGVADQPASQAALAMESASGTVAVAAGGADIRLRFGPLDAMLSEVGLPEVELPDALVTPRYLPALAFAGGSDAVAVVWLEGLSSSARARVAVVGPGAPPSASTTLAEGKLPPYGPSVAYRDGVLAVAWTENTPEPGGYRVKVATFGAE